MKDTQSFSKKIRDFPPLENVEEDVSYDVESLFTNIPVKETVNYILDQIYVHKTLQQICYYRLIFKKLLMKLGTEVTFTFNNKFYKQIDGCTMGGPLSVTLSDIYIYIYLYIYIYIYRERERERERERWKLKLSVH